MEVENGDDDKTEIEQIMGGKEERQ